MAAPRPLIAGNWKMNGLASSLDQVRAIAAAVDEKPPPARVALFPPATLIRPLADLLAGTAILVGGQDCRAEPLGAFTGDIAPEMLVDAGAAMVILGHSERRAGHGETDAIVAAKVAGALRAGLEPIICVGESEEERARGAAMEIVAAQVRGSVPDEIREYAFSIAYEPVWAIGSGKTPTTSEIVAMHRDIRRALVAQLGEPGARAPILYGGSVKPANAAEILGCEEVSGALVGGASLTAAEFLPILRAL